MYGNVQPLFIIEAISQTKKCEDSLITPASDTETDGTKEKQIKFHQTDYSSLF